jgi:hypothetical protein
MELVSSVIKTKVTYVFAALGVADALNPDCSTSKGVEELRKQLKVSWVMPYLLPLVNIGLMCMQFSDLQMPHALANRCRGRR